MIERELFFHPLYEFIFLLLDIQTQHNCDFNFCIIVTLPLLYRSCDQVVHQINQDLTSSS